MIGLSNANFNPPPQTQASALIGNSPLYAMGLNANSGFNVGRNSTNTLQYPLDIGKYIITFTFSEYTRADLNSVGTFKDSGYPGIVMPLPQQLVNPDAVDWHEEEIGTLPGAFVSGMASVLQGQGFGTNATTTPAVAALGLGGMASAATTFLGAPSAGSTAVESLMGFSPNQFVVLLMRGPKFKRHNFTWEVSPTNASEAEVLRQIIKTFKNIMAPNVYGAFAGSPILWTFPKIVYVRLYPNSKFLYKFKPCVCDHFTVNYTPGNRAAFNVNKTNTVGENAPSNVQLNAHFIELEYWIEGNNTDSNDPDDVHNIATNTSTLATNAAQTPANQQQGPTQ